MTLQLIPDAGGDVRNARFLALACDFAYYPQVEGAPKFLEQLGLTANLTSINNTQAYVATNDEHIVVAFRGSESPTSIDGLKDWLLTNALNLLVLPEGDIGTDFAAAGVGARFHRGFMCALADVWPTLYPVIEAEVKKKDRLLWVTGHSLGGALATLASWRLHRKFVEVHQVYTFGAPMVGNNTAMAAYDKEFTGRIFRYVNLRDVVPRLPTMSLIANDYCHCETEMGVRDPDFKESSIETMTAMAGKMVGGILHASLMDDLWSLVKERISAHDIANYHKWIA